MALRYPDIDSHIVLEAVGMAYDMQVNDTGASLAAAINHQVSEGNSLAIYIPAVKFVIDASLHVLTHPEVAVTIPPNVRRRARLGVAVATDFMSMGVELDLFRELHTNSPILSQLPLSESQEHGFRDRGALISLGTSPFVDTKFISGGAARLLRREAIEPTQTADIIGQSTGLLAWAGIDKLYASLAYHTFGKVYLHTKHIQLETTETGVQVAFNENAKRQLATFYSEGSGCSFGRIPAGSNETDTPLVSYWKQLVNYLIQPDAVVA